MHALSRMRRMASCARPGPYGPDARPSATISTELDHESRPARTIFSTIRRSARNAKAMSSEHLLVACPDLLNCSSVKISAVRVVSLFLFTLVMR
jgi:hypothetical protein